MRALGPSDATNAESRRAWVSYVLKFVALSFFSPAGVLGGIFAVSCVSG
jgi:hypothetical protein